MYSYKVRDFVEKLRKFQMVCGNQSYRTPTSGLGWKRQSHLHIERVSNTIEFPSSNAEK
jgi:hypothetical protein